MQRPPQSHGIIDMNPVKMTASQGPYDLGARTDLNNGLYGTGSSAQGGGEDNGPSAVDQSYLNMQNNLKSLQTKI